MIKMSRKELNRKNKTSTNRSNKVHARANYIIQFKFSGNSLYVYEIKKER